jgi:hypothetical protein
MKFCNDNGIRVMVWSGGGVDYAKTWVRRIDPNNEANVHVFHKSPGLLGEGHFIVDDMEPVIKLAKELGADAYWIPFFEPAINQNDTELYQLKAILQAKIKQ